MRIKKVELEEFRDIYTTQNLAALATQDEGQPHCSLVAFAVTSDLRQLFFATKRDTHKYACITADSRVSLLIDDRKNQASDFGATTAITLHGHADELSEAEKKPFVQIYIQKHPHLKDFVTSPACAFFRVIIEKVRWVHNFAEVFEMIIT